MEVVEYWNGVMTPFPSDSSPREGATYIIIVRLVPGEMEEVASLLRVTKAFVEAKASFAVWSVEGKPVQMW